MTNKKLIVGNWKMHGRTIENRRLITELLEKMPVHFANVAIAAPYLYLPEILNQIDSSQIALAAQDVSRFENDGAYTGEISAQMLHDIGVSYVLIGHSERRQYFAEDNNIISRKYKSALNAGLTPVLCVGESLVERDNGQAKEVIASQLEVLLDVDFLSQIVAYEPVWAIGSGKVASAEQIAEIHSFIKLWVLQKLGGAVSIRVLYGGSVKACNATTILSIMNVDGALIGGSSLQASEFLSIIANTPKS